MIQVLKHFQHYRELPEAEEPRAGLDPPETLACQDPKDLKEHMVIINQRHVGLIKKNHLFGSYNLHYGTSYIII